MYKEDSVQPLAHTGYDQITLLGMLLRPLICPLICPLFDTFPS